MNTPEQVPIWVWFILIPTLIAQGTGLFIHARKSGRFPWLWGLWGFTSIPMPTLIYLIFVVKPWRRKQTKD
ncbi:sigmaY antisigma factor component [Paenibacillus sp. 1001270B_150601_E10]|uniref:sigmaY antisigma factor component n=1 Tax=Paenibacillus sp. 1001270B_150601_E10 TaxID=2787079 RepID=UPI00189F71DE|nr:sigmaY antisigma factor component [Paenibacillus sp. 1001270B_150601_E10]